MGWALFGIGFAALWGVGILTQFSGQLAGRLRFYLSAISGTFLLLTALYLFFLAEPWAPPDKAVSAAGVHTGAGAALYAVLMFAFYAGPQLTGLTLAAVSLYVLRGARDMYWMLRR
jgi:hypothetical protein